MPLGRYFIFVGSLLVALLFLADWVWPSSPPAPAQQVASEALTDDLSLSIRSRQKWPDKVVLDTSMPTIVPPPAPVASAEVPPPPPVNASPLEARAELKPTVQPAPPPKRQARVVHRRAPRAAPSAWAAANPAREWSWNW